ncbi:unnamed protein product [Camellia sinensis]
MDLLLPQKPNQAHWAHLLLGLHLLPLKTPRIHRHPSHHPQHQHQTALLPPRVPPRRGCYHVLPVALHITVSPPSGARYQRLRSHANVRILLIVRAGEASVVEEIGDRLSDYTVRVQLCGVGFDVVLSFHRIRVLRDLGLVLQCGFQRFAFGSFR